MQIDFVKMLMFSIMTHTWGNMIFHILLWIDTSAVHFLSIYFQIALKLRAFPTAERIIRQTCSVMEGVVVLFHNKNIFLTSGVEKIKSSCRDNDIYSKPQNRWSPYQLSFLHAVLPPSHSNRKPPGENLINYIESEQFKERIAVLCKISRYKVCGNGDFFINLNADRGLTSPGEYAI